MQHLKVKTWSFKLFGVVSMFITIRVVERLNSELGFGPSSVGFYGTEPGPLKTTETAFH